MEDNRGRRYAWMRLTRQSQPHGERRTQRAYDLQVSDNHSYFYHLQVISWQGGRTKDCCFTVLNPRQLVSTTTPESGTDEVHAGSSTTTTRQRRRVVSDGAVIAQIRTESGAGHRRTLDITSMSMQTTGAAGGVGRISELQDLCVVSAILLLCKEH